ncbi:MAG: SUMF1/EgtB/PvdO family nonheme iron enzyme, partial [Candidatus Latescibacteria bacterium]|nr:SUMF1/EgtB/PvdO family nonheme iron enzyme [Candidatus Latescibacterota bacterium]
MTVRAEGRIQIDVPWPPDSVSTGLPQELQTSTGPMVLIPSGEFLMGDAFDEGVKSDERPQHRIYLDAFYIDKYEVTNAQYKA